MVFGRRESTSTASAWPSSAAMNGLENMRSILAAFSARVRSRARANGCCNGSKFLCVGVGSPGRAGRWAEGACCRTEIFCESVGQSSKDVEYSRITTIAALRRPGCSFVGLKFSAQFSVISQLVFERFPNPSCVDDRPTTTFSNTKNFPCQLMFNLADLAVIQYLLNLAYCRV
jgi:hypothetical protein